MDFRNDIRTISKLDKPVRYMIYMENRNGHERKEKREDSPDSFIYKWNKE